MTIECPVLPQLKPWYDAFYDALEELARERGDGACKATFAELRIQRRRGVWLNLQTLANVPGAARQREAGVGAQVETEDDKKGPDRAKPSRLRARATGIGYGDAVPVSARRSRDTKPWHRWRISGACRRIA